MERLKELLQKLKIRLWTLLRQIEESEIFERIVNRFESLDPVNQRRLKVGSSLFVIALAIYLLISPIMDARKKANTLTDGYKLVEEMKQFASKQKRSQSQYPKPNGWQMISTGTIQQLMGSIKIYLASIGLTEDRYEIQQRGNNLSLIAREATIRQLKDLQFQIDALYPDYSVQRLKAFVHGEKKDLIGFELDIQTGADFVLREEGPEEEIDVLDDRPPPPRQEPNAGYSPPPPASEDRRPEIERSRNKRVIEMPRSREEDLRSGRRDREGDVETLPAKSPEAESIGSGRPGYENPPPMPDDGPFPEDGDLGIPPPPQLDDEDFPPPPAEDYDP